MNNISITGTLGSITDNLDAVEQSITALMI